MVKAAFLDRDGVLNTDTGYPHKIDQLNIIAGVPDALRLLAKADFQLFIVSNQSGIGRGYFTSVEVDAFNRHLLHMLRNQNINIRDVVYCPHIPEDHCLCRKPKPKLLLDLVERYSINKNKSIMIGDKETDVKAGLDAGLPVNLKVEPNTDFALLGEIKRYFEVK